MGKRSSKTTQVVQNSIPAWVENAAQANVNFADQLSSGVMGRYANGGPSSFIAPFSADTEAGFTLGRNFANGSTANDIRNLSGSVSGYRNAAAAGLDPDSQLNGTINAALNGMGRIANRSAPQFTPYSALAGDQVSAQNLQAADMQAEQMQAAGMQAAQMQSAQMQSAQMDDVAKVGARQGADFMSSYMNPYMNQVVDASLADYDVGVDRQAAQNRARRDAGSAFGDRAAIADAVFSADSNRGRSAVASNLRSDAFNTAANFGMQDSNRFLEADRANQQVALQRATENARLQQAAAEANARMQQEAYQANAGFLQDANATNARFIQDASSANARLRQDAGEANARMLQEARVNNARMAQEAAFKNADIGNQFKLSNDQRLRDLEMQNFNAGLTNDELALKAFNSQASTAQGQQMNQAQLAQILAGIASGQAGLLTSADDAEARRIATQTAIGTAIDEQNQAVLREPLDMLEYRARILGQTPYPTTQTSTTTQSSNGLRTLLGLGRMIPGIGALISQ